MSCELCYRSSRRAPKLTTPALAKAYGELSKESERSGKSGDNKKSTKATGRARS